MFRGHQKKKKKVCVAGVGGGGNYLCDTDGERQEELKGYRLPCVFHPLVRRMTLSPYLQQRLFDFVSSVACLYNEARFLHLPLSRLAGRTTQYSGWTCLSYTRVDFKKKKKRNARNIWLRANLDG